MVTRDDVARVAGTSTAVVSYVMNNGPRPVSQATRERVERAIRETGYQPNRLAKALSGRHSRVIGLIVPDSSNAFFGGLAQAIEEEAYRHGYYLLLGNSAEDGSREIGYVRAFLEHRVEGLVLVSAASQPDLSHETKKLLNASGVPLVLVDRNHPVRGASVLLVDNEQGGRLATEHLIHDHGLREVWCLAGPEGLALSDERVEGWRSALKAVGVAPGREWVRHSAFSRFRASEVTAEWLGSARAPRALFVCSDEQALGVLVAARRLKHRVPEDLAVVSFDGTPQAEFAQPGLTTVEQPLSDIGRRAVDRLLHAGDAPRRRQVERLATRLKVRASCGCEPDPWLLAGSHPSSRSSVDDTRPTSPVGGAGS